MQSESIKSSSSVKSSVRTRYKLADGSRYVQEAEESSLSYTEDEAERSSQKVKEGNNTISGKNSKIAKVKNSVTLQGAWVHLVEEPWQISWNDFMFPILFNTIVEKNFFASKFSPRVGVSCLPAIYIITHNNDIFVQMKRGESLGKLVSLMVRSENGQISTREG